MKNENIYYIDLDEVKTIRLLNVNKLKRKETKQTLDWNPEHQTPVYRNLMYGSYIVFFSFAIVVAIYLTLYFERTLWNYIILFFLSTLALSCISFVYMMSKGEKDRRDEGWFDTWSISHLSLKIFLPLLIYYFSDSLFWAFFGTISFAVVWELIEWKVVEKIWYNFGGEDLPNHLSDIVTAVIGCTIASIIITYGLI